MKTEASEERDGVERGGVKREGIEYALRTGAVDVFDVHEALADGLRQEDGPFGEIAEVLYEMEDDPDE